MAENIILQETTSNKIRILRLNRPNLLNALGEELVTALEGEIEALNKQDVRAVVFASTSEKAFCAGADLKARMAMTLPQAKQFVQRLSVLFRRIEQLEVPTVAAIDGVAFGGGLELALACDFRIVNADAWLGLTECALGIMPGAGGTQRLWRIIGLSRAKELIFSAQKISGKEAFDMGLADRLVPPEGSGLDAALLMLERMVKNAPLAIKAAKRAVMEGYALDIDQGLEIEHVNYEQLLGTADRQEGLTAFAEKRFPNFTGA
jgi:enoyl-CoA hydratase/carnithine racemase